MQYLSLLMCTAERGSEQVLFAEHKEVASWMVVCLSYTLCAGLGAVMCCQISGNHELQQPSPILSWHPSVAVQSRELGVKYSSLTGEFSLSATKFTRLFKNKFSAFRYCDFFHSKCYPCNLLHISKLLETASCFSACQIPPQLPGRE